MGQIEHLAAFGADEGASRGGGERFDTGQDEGHQGGEDEGLQEEDQSVEEEAQGATGDIGESALAGIDGVGAFAGDGGEEERPADEVSGDDEDGDQGQTDGGQVKDRAEDIEEGPAEGEAGESDEAPESGDEDDGCSDGEEAGERFGETEAQGAVPGDGDSPAEFGGDHAREGESGDDEDEEHGDDHEGRPDGVFVQGVARGGVDQSPDAIGDIAGVEAACGVEGGARGVEHAAGEVAEWSGSINEELGDFREEGDGDNGKEGEEETLRAEGEARSVEEFGPEEIVEEVVEGDGSPGRGSAGGSRG